MSIVLRDERGRIASVTEVEKVLVDYEKDRPLAGGNPIRDLIPDAKWIPYGLIPHLSDTHYMMGYDGGVKTKDDINIYASRRDELFALMPLMYVEIKGLVFTQECVDYDGKPLNVNKRPVSVVCHNNVMYLMDGHHRTVGNYLDGEKIEAARVLSV